jgi:hypothetical protein
MHDACCVDSSMTLLVCGRAEVGAARGFGDHGWRMGPCVSGTGDEGTCAGCLLSKM